MNAPYDFSFPWGAGASVALLILIGPIVEVKTVEGDALDPDANLGNEWADFGIEPVAVHAEVVGASRRRMSRGSKLGQEADTHTPVNKTRVRSGKGGRKDERQPSALHSGMNPKMYVEWKTTPTAPSCLVW